MSHEDDEQQATSLFDRFRVGRENGEPGNVRALSDEPITDTPLPEDDEPSEAIASEPDSHMPLEARRALVLLLRQGVVMADSKRLAFETLCQHEALITHQLGNMFMRMLLDPKAGIAILLSQDDDDSDDDNPDDDEESASLITKRTLTLYDTLLLLVLRRYYQERETAGEQKIVIDIARMEALMTPFLPLTHSSRSERRNLSGALDFLKRKRLIAGVRGDADRFEITPVIRYVVNAEFLERLLEQYQRLSEAPTSQSNGVAE